MFLIEPNNDVEIAIKTRKIPQLNTMRRKKENFLKREKL
jgi:hypothetical protein